MFRRKPYKDKTTMTEEGHLVYDKLKKEKYVVCNMVILFNG